MRAISKARNIKINGQNRKIIKDNESQTHNITFTRTTVLL